MYYKTQLRLIRAKNTLKSAIQHILEINKKKYAPSFHRFKPEEKKAIQEELRIWNKIAEHKAKMIKMYEERLKEATA